MCPINFGWGSLYFRHIGWFPSFPYYRLINIRWFLSFPYFRLINIEWVPSLKTKKFVGFPYFKIDKFGGFTKFTFHVFSIDMKFISNLFSILLMEMLSFSDPHLHKIILKIYTQSLFVKYMFQKNIFTNTHVSKNMVDVPFEHFGNMRNSRFSEMKNNIFNDDSMMFLVFFEIRWW